MYHEHNIDDFEVQVGYYLLNVQGHHIEQCAEWYVASVGNYFIYFLDHMPTFYDYETLESASCVSRVSYLSRQSNNPLWVVPIDDVTMHTTKEDMFLYELSKDMRHMFRGWLEGNHLEISDNFEMKKGLL